jgi:hypothetical protein
MQVARLAPEPELQEAVGKSPTMIDGPLTQSALIAKIVFVFQLERVVRQLCVFVFDACLGFSHFFAPSGNPAFEGAKSAPNSECRCKVAPPIMPNDPHLFCSVHGVGLPTPRVGCESFGYSGYPQVGVA